MLYVSARPQDAKLDNVRSESAVLAAMLERVGMAREILAAARALFPRVTIDAFLAPSEADHQAIARRAAIGDTAAVVAVDSDFPAIHGETIIKVDVGTGGITRHSGAAVHE